MSEGQSKPVEILLVEDNEGDIFLTKKAFEKAKISNNIQVAMDGEQALDILNDASTPKPDLILLDINMPKKDGKQVLEEIKNDDVLKRIPVVVLTSSKAESDIMEMYDRYTSSYIVKPIDLQKFSEVVSAIENFWFKVVTLPPHT